MEEKEELIKKVKEFIELVKWTKTTSKNYENAPHEWIFIKRWKIGKELKNILEYLIKDYGYDNYFFKAKFRYIDIDDYQYWICDKIVNRVKKKDSVTNIKFKKKNKQISDF